MKLIIIALFSISLISCAKSSGGSSDATMSTVDNGSNPNHEQNASEEMEKDNHVLSPEDEALFFGEQKFEKATTFKFAQTTWKECTDVVTGNYYGYACSNSRAIAVILKSFMDNHMYKCVNAGLAAQGGGTVADYHIVHAGIFADPRHSPRSLHSENRAIDIKSMQVQLTTGQTKTFTFEGTGSTAFFGGFRKCWGDIVHNFNGCPYYASSASLTGTIGKENADHQHHMHTSVPYCVNGQYGAYYYQK